MTGLVLLQAVLSGTVATIATDLWALLLRKGFGLRSLDWAMAGRWFGHVSRGRWRHARITDAPPVAGERLLGWSMHYVTGVVFAVLLLALMGEGWARAPTLLPCLAFGIATVAFPFLLMQPGMGAGIAAARTPSPWRARLQSLATHGVFGIGLFVGAQLSAFALNR